MTSSAVFGRSGSVVMMSSRFSVPDLFSAPTLGRASDSPGAYPQPPALNRSSGAPVGGRVYSRSHDRYGLAPGFRSRDPLAGHEGSRGRAGRGRGGGAGAGGHRGLGRPAA